MKKIKLINIAFLSLFILSITGCKKEEPHVYLEEKESINFYLHNIQGSTMDNTHVINTWANNSSGATEATADFSVQIMGKAGDYQRRAYTRAVETIGWQVPLPISEYVFEPGEGRIIANQIPMTHVPRGRMTTWVIEFDYEKSDFNPGIVSRQVRTVTVDNRYNMSSVNISQSNWQYNEEHTGPWSNIKAMFMAETLETFDFMNKVFIPLLSSGTRNELLGRLRTALEEYKVKSAADPVNYPPLLDDEKNDGTWIGFPS